MAQAQAADHGVRATAGDICTESQATVHSKVKGAAVAGIVAAAVESGVRATRETAVGWQMAAAAVAVVVVVVLVLVLVVVVVLVAVFVRNHNPVE